MGLGIAKALRYLHRHGLPGGGLGSELSPEKIIVDGRDEPRLRLITMVCTDTKSLIYSAYVAPGTLTDLPLVIFIGV